MAVEEVTDLVAGLNISISLALVVASLFLLVAAAAMRMPWSMLAGAVAIVLLGLAGLISALARFHYFTDITDAPLLLLTLRIAALILLAGGAWTLSARWLRQRRMDGAGEDGA